MVAKTKKREKGVSFQNVFFSFLIGFFLLGTVGFLVVSSLNINQKRSEMTERIGELKEEIRLLEERNDSLRAGIIDTESDVYWEEKMRERGYKKPGEEAVVVLPPEETKEEPTGEKSLWQKFLDKIGF